MSDDYDDEKKIKKKKKKKKKSKKNKNKRTLDVQHKDIRNRLTLEADCITLEDSKKELRVKMDCGHVVGPKTMFLYVKMTFEKDLHQTKVICPVPKCGAEWPWDLVTRVGDFSNDEYVRFTAIIQNRLKKDEQACPSCNSFVERPSDLTMFRVNCTNCTGPDFCWTCMNSWKGSGFQICGNKGCAIENVNNVLQTCKMITPEYISTKVPSTRACPNCLTLIEHERACKHMKCLSCKHDFCFLCLKPKKNGTWQCGTHQTECTVAPRQVLK